MNRWLTLTRAEAVSVFGCICGLGLLAADIRAGGLFTGLDRTVRGDIQPHGTTTSPWLAIPAGMGDIWLSLACLLAASLVAAQISWRLWPFVVAAVNFTVVQVSVLLLKLVVGRPGPGVWADRTGYPGYFPSGHATTSAVCAGTMIWLILAARGITPGARTRAVVIGLALLVGALSGWAALLKDTHWFTDVIGGLLLAWVALTLGLEFGTACVEGRIGGRARDPA